jgi:hypothetical protein
LKFLSFIKIKTRIEGKDKIIKEFGKLESNYIDNLNLKSFRLTKLQRVEVHNLESRFKEIKKKSFHRNFKEA